VIRLQLQLQNYTNEGHGSPWGETEASLDLVDKHEVLCLCYFLCDPLVSVIAIAESYESRTGSLWRANEALLSFTKKDETDKRKDDYD